MFTHREIQQQNLQRQIDTNYFFESEQALLDMFERAKYEAHIRSIFSPEAAERHLRNYDTYHHMLPSPTFSYKKQATKKSHKKDKKLNTFSSKFIANIKNKYFSNKNKKQGKEEQPLTRKFDIVSGELAYCHNICSKMPKYSEIIFNQTIMDCEKELDSLYTDYQIQSSEEFKFSNFHNEIIKQTFQLFSIKYKKDMDNNWIGRLIEDIAGLYLLIKKSFHAKTFDRELFLFAITNFIRLRYKKGLMECIEDMELYKYAEQVFSEISRIFEVQSFEENVSFFRESLDKFTIIKDSVIFKKIYKLCLYALSMSVFDKVGINFSTFGYTVFEAEAIKKKYHMGVDFIQILCDTLLFCCERGFQILKTGNLQVLFHSGETYTKFLDDVTLLKRQSLLLANPEAHGFNESSFRANLDDTIERGVNIVQHSNKMSIADKRFTRSLLNDLEYIRCDLCTKRAAREHRPAPYSVLIFGESGIGKSTIKDMLFYQFAKLKDLDSDSSFCYTRNPVANFWDGFTTSQWAVILDDIASIHPDKASSGDPSMMELIQIINSVPFVPDQADLSDKGRTPLKCKFVMATTNVKTLNAQYYFSHPSAVQRRLPFIITPTVKVQYAKSDGTLDSSLVVNTPGEYPDLWNWKVEEVKTRKTTDPQKLADINVLLETDDILEFLRWFNKSVTNFDKNQAIVSESINLMKQIDICKSCFLPVKRCDCELQSVEEAFQDMGYLTQLTMDFIIRFLNNFVVATLIHFFGQFWWGKLIYTYVTTMMSAKRKYQYCKRRMYLLGERVKNKIGYFGILASVITLLTSVGYVYKLYNTFNCQGNVSESIGTKPTAKDEEKENVWYKNDFKLSTFDLSSQITSSKSLSRDDFIKIIQRNLVHFTLHTRENKCIKSKAVCLSGQKYMTNNHNIPIIDGMMDLTVIIVNAKDGINENITFSITESQINRNVKDDLLIITLPNLPPKKDITTYFPKHNIDIKTNGFYVSRSEDGDLYTNNLKCIKYIEKFAIEALDINRSIWFSDSSEKCQLGDCGSVFIGETAMGFVILGIHVLGSSLGKGAGAISINKDTIDKMLIRDMHTIQSGAPDLNTPNTNRQLADLHHKSIFRYLDDGSAATYGSFAGFRPTHKSAVCHTPMSYHLSQHDYKINYGAPIMKGWEPWRVAAEDTVKPVVDIDSNTLDQCVEAFTDDILKSIGSLDEIHVYDNFTAINGAQGVSYIDKINRNTSAGNPWKKSKKFFMEAIPAEHGLSDPVKVDDEVMDRVDKMIETYQTGTRVMPNFCAHLKDEAVSFKKIKMKKTRVFTGAPFDWTIVVRKYLLSTVRLVQNNRFIFESAPGTIAQSSEWTEMYKYITKYGSDRIIAGDYKAFDKRMSPVFILASFKILRNICEASNNYSKADLRVIDGIAQDTAFPLIDYNGDLIEFYGSNPSGHPLTVIINGLCNALYMRYVYLKLNPMQEVVSFKEQVNLMTYGDDNIMSVHKSNSWYNHTTISEYFKIMGITYTMADKEAASIPLINIKDASFLKRTFVFDEEIGYYLAPLEHDSIEKMLMVWVRSKSISTEEQSISVISSAIREYFFYGKEVYNKKRDLLIQLVHDMDMDDWVHESVFPTWDHLKSEFYRNSGLKNY